MKAGSHMQHKCKCKHKKTRVNYNVPLANASANARNGYICVKVVHTCYLVLVLAFALLV